MLQLFFQVLMTAKKAKGQTHRSKGAEERNILKRRMLISCVSSGMWGLVLECMESIAFKISISF